MSIWGQTIKRYRNVNALKQAALADILGVNQAAISRWERGIDVPNLGAQRKLRDLFRRKSGLVQDNLVHLAVRSSRFEMGVFAASSPVCLSLSAGTEPKIEEFGLTRTDLEGQDLTSIFEGSLGELTASLKEIDFHHGVIAAVEAVTTYAKQVGDKQVVQHIHTRIHPHWSETGSILRIAHGKFVSAEEAAKIREDLGGNLRFWSFDNFLDGG